ncbi:hypothetical protein KQI42_17520 [Tissierella sp. MSJ-40]|uniref:Uncharacterized protein n=1 Tax=Tissierella simiarum TaxID=2841534 RepID=A0ABS6EAM9_9FIRM|nr:hypothetical protein [Tissierella simiarum]MBU5439819.1 hypothetical protein [Tissierella simiarum]
MMWVSNLQPRRSGIIINNYKQISRECYGIYQIAKTIWIGKESIEINEMADVDLIYDKVFKAFINSVLIARYVIDIFLITK